MDAVAPGAVPAAPLATVDYPVKVELEAPNEIARWRPIAHFFMAIPHFIVSQALQALLGAVTLIAFFAILFTKKYPEGLFRVAVMAERYNWRTTSFALYLREAYPPFDFQMELEDPRLDPARFSVEYPAELNRWLPLVKWFLAIPHFFVLLGLFVGGAAVVVLSFFAVLFTGKYPEGMRNYMVGTTRWYMRVTSYVCLLTDRYPPFSLR
ncbi:MAG TPA: DUF4389 domain-containing protein [Actinomycetota bacterium]|nr:DUF4389 domain-containing protein [Actinomycetota bacterium]